MKRVLFSCVAMVGLLIINPASAGFGLLVSSSCGVGTSPSCDLHGGRATITVTIDGDPGDQLAFYIAAQYPSADPPTARPIWSRVRHFRPRLNESRTFQFRTAQFFPDPLRAGVDIFYMIVDEGRARPLVKDEFSLDFRENP